VAARTRESSSSQVNLNKGGRGVEANNTAKAVNKYKMRIILPTHTNCQSTESILKHYPMYAADMNMPPKKKQKAVSPKPSAIHFTELEYIFIRKVWFCISQMLL
jgi:hypothetical protein